MIINTLGSGSSGNCYLLTSKTTNKQIILDCGISLREIIKHKNFNGIRNVDFAFSSHNHQDHRKYAQDIKKCGIKLITEEDLGNKVRQIGQWNILLFEVAHNVKNCGIVIADTTTNQKLCYVTDFSSMPKIEGIDIWLYEINHDDKTVLKALEKDTLESVHINNSLKNHNSLEKAIEYFKALKYPPKQIILCHLSNDFGSRKTVLKEMKQFCDNVKVAEKGD